jgi:hypothetical protein
MSVEQQQQARPITIDGLTREQILQLPDEHVAALMAVGPVVFNVGSAHVLGQIRLDVGCLTIELAQIEGGGEGVLMAMSAVAEAFARQRGIVAIEWIVHAVTCAQPNLKLRRVLEKRGFEIKDLPSIGAAYHYRQEVAA